MDRPSSRRPQQAFGSPESCHAIHSRVSAVATRQQKTWWTCAKSGTQLGRQSFDVNQQFSPSLVAGQSLFGLSTCLELFTANNSCRTSPHDFSPPWIKCCAHSPVDYRLLCHDSSMIIMYRIVLCRRRSFQRCIVLHGCQPCLQLP